MKFDQVPRNPNRTRLEPIRDGIPVGAIRTRPAERQHCGCDYPKFDEHPMRRTYAHNGERVVELRICRLCGLGRKDAPGM